LPEAITGGPTRLEARANALDGLEVTLLTYASDGRDLPPDIPVAGDVETISPSAQVAAKIAFIEAFRKSGLSNVALAARVGKGENEVRRMLDPYYGSKLKQLEAGMKALGKRFVLTVEEAA
jgi:antitoxin HicB